MNGITGNKNTEETCLQNPGKKKVQNNMILAKPSGGVMVESIYFRTCQLAKNKLPAIHLCLFVFCFQEAPGIIL